jgi:hypothetical protein
MVTGTNLIIMKHKPTLDTMWNDLVSIKNNPKAPQKVKEMADMLVRQLNTAGGKQIIGDSTLNWLIENKKYFTK